MIFYHLHRTNSRECKLMVLITANLGNIFHQFMFPTFLPGYRKKDTVGHKTKLNWVFIDNLYTVTACT